MAVVSPVDHTEVATVAVVVTAVTKVATAVVATVMVDMEVVKMMDTAADMVLVPVGTDREDTEAKLAVMAKEPADTEAARQEEVETDMEDTVVNIRNCEREKSRTSARCRYNHRTIINNRKDIDVG